MNARTYNMNLEQEARKITSEVIRNRKDATDQGLIGRVGAVRILTGKGLSREEAREKLARMTPVMREVNDIELPHWKVEDLV